MAGGLASMFPTPDDETVMNGPPKSGREADVLWGGQKSNMAPMDTRMGRNVAGCGGFARENAALGLENSQMGDAWAVTLARIHRNSGLV